LNHAPQLNLSDLSETMLDLAALSATILLAFMSAVEVIDQIKHLPPDEQQVVKDFVQAMGENKASPKYASDAEFDKVMDGVFRDYENLFRSLAQ
jgi:hypothetical protein